MPINLKQNDQAWLLPIKVTPKSAKNQVLHTDEADTELKLKVTAAPEDSQANAAVVKLLSKVLGIAKSQVNIHRGEQSRHKIISVNGIESPQMLIEALAKASNSPSGYFVITP